jgi:outer membrane lipoprotein-sorting protein
MRKLVLVMAGLIAVSAVNAQSIEEIVKNYSIANKQDKVSAMSTIKITGRMSLMGMEMPMEMWMKNPDKIKTVTNINGQEMVAAFDGVKGYQINPMTGSSDPVEMSADEIKQTQNNNVFRNYMVNYLKEGKLSLEGEENVNDKPAFKIKANLEGGNTVNMYIDKVSYLMVKTSATINQGGTTITADSFMTDYADNSGVMLPMKTTTSAGGMEFTITFDKVEVNIPIDDSVFTIK